MKKLTCTLAFAALLFGLAPLAEAQVPAPNLVTTCGPGDLIQDIVGGIAQPYSTYITCLNLAGYNGQLPAKSNLLIAGDATQNLFQRGTTGASVTTTATYGGPDRWFYWSGTSTAMTVSRDSTAADLPATGYEYAYKMARTSGQTGVVQMCMAQIIETPNVYQMQGTTVELDFHAIEGATAASAGDVFNAYIVTGTVANEGASDLAFGVNAGGGGSQGWTGQANAASPVIPINASAGRYGVVATIPTGALEAAVVLCDTPVGTAGATDYAAFAGIQLIRNSSAAPYVAASTGYLCSLNTGGTGSSGLVLNCSSFDRSRNNELEALLQYRYYYQITEGAAFTQRGMCEIDTTSIALCNVVFPVPMRAAPTMTYVTGFAALNVATAVQCTGNTTASVPTGNAANTFGVMMDCASSAGFSAASTAAVWGDDGGTGKIEASAEL
jgi:hypothetical protein